jgi:ribosomal-protein-alanine N-acetyltransferase
MQNYTLKTQRLGLRFLSPDDLDKMTDLNSDQDVRFFFPEGILTPEQTALRMHTILAYQDNGLPCFLIFELDTEEFVGRSGFGPIENKEIEIGYVLHKKFWGKGYAAEVVTLLLEWATSHIRTEYIVAYAPEQHLASRRVMEKCGMQPYKNEIARGVPCCFYRIKNQKIE